MRTEQSNRHNNQPSPIETPEMTLGFNDGIVPGYIRERIKQQREKQRKENAAREMAARALNSEAILQHETIFPYFPDLKDMPQTD